jgi:outer membrane murein-binding lipoprotein Lpp
MELSLAMGSVPAGLALARRNRNVAPDHLEDEMRTLSRIAVAAIVASPLLLGAGCAQRSDINSLRSDVDALRAEVGALRTDLGVLSGDIMAADKKAEQAARDAAAAAAAAERAAVEAKAAADKSDKIYRQSLRK